MDKDPRVSKKNNMLGALLVVLAGCCWGTSGTLQAFAPTEATPMTVGASRAMGSAIVLFAICMLTNPRGFFSGRWRIFPVFISGFGLALYQLAFFASARMTGAGVAAVVAIGSSPAIAGFIGRIFFRERLSAKWFASTALAVGGGVLLVSGGIEGAAAISVPGILLALLAGFAYSLEGVGVRMIGNERTSLELTAAIFMMSALLTLPFLLTTDSLWIFTPRGFTVAALLSVASSALPFCLFTRGILTVGVARSYTLTLSEPLTACVLAALVLDQRLTPTAIAGVGVICCGIALLATDIK